MRKAETRLRNKIIKALEVEYPLGLFRHIHGNMFQQAGIPDILGCINGTFIGIEVKEPGQEPTKIQLYELKLIKRAGGVSGSVDNIEDALELAKKCL